MAHLALTGGRKEEKERGGERGRIPLDAVLFEFRSSMELVLLPTSVVPFLPLLTVYGDHKVGAGRSKIAFQGATASAVKTVADLCWRGSVWRKSAVANRLGLVALLSCSYFAWFNSRRGL